MTAATDLLTDAYGRVQEAVHRAVEGLGPDDLATRLAPDANSIAWLVWHLTRVQDDHIADVAGTAQVWTEDGWDKRFDLPLPAGDTGYGHTSAQVAEVRGLTADQLTGYYDAVHARTIAYLQGLADTDFARIVDTNWTPHVTLGVRLISVVDDDLEHAGQAAFIHGILTPR